MLTKTILQDAAQLKRWQEGQKDGFGPKTNAQVDEMRQPLSYPAILVFDWIPDLMAKDILHYSYVYQEDWTKE